MAMIDGDDAISGQVESFQQHNRIKNHWRQSDPRANLSNPQNGMIVSDSDDDKLYHKISGAGLGSGAPDYDEILQALTSSDISPVFDGVILNIESSDVSDPPTEAELNAIWPTAVAGFTGYVHDSSSGGKLYQCIFDGLNWWTFTGALAGS